LRLISNADEDRRCSKEAMIWLLLSIIWKRLDKKMITWTWFLRGRWHWIRQADMLILRPAWHGILSGETSLPLLPSEKLNVELETTRLRLELLVLVGSSTVLSVLQQIRLQRLGKISAHARDSDVSRRYDFQLW
jgi:hypothetical protein